MRPAATLTTPGTSIRGRHAPRRVAHLRLRNRRLTGELKNPKTDTFKAISTRDCYAWWSTHSSSFAFQGFLGLGSMLQRAAIYAAGVIATPAV
jgi:hypothetical protein